MTGTFLRWAGLTNNAIVKTRDNPKTVHPDFLFHDFAFANQRIKGRSPPLLRGDWLVTQVSVVGGFKVKGRVFGFPEQ